MKWTTHSAEQTLELGLKLGQKLPSNSVVCFFGGLGAGKTTFIKGVAAGVTGTSEQVNSPTFIYLNIYSGLKTLYHFDLYRLKSEEEFLSMGFEEFMSSGGVCCLEWSEKIPNLLPEDCIAVTLEPLDEHTREITIAPWENL